MAKKRFVEVYSQGVATGNIRKIIVDTETGVNYLMGSHNMTLGGTGMTVLVGQDGKPIVTPMND